MTTEDDDMTANGKHSNEVSPNDTDMVAGDKLLKSYLGAGKFIGVDKTGVGIAEMGFMDGWYAAIGWKASKKYANNEKHLSDQIKILSDYLQANHPDMIRDGGAVDVAILTMKTQYAAIKHELTYCAYCGHEELVDGDGQKIAEHIATCEKHPMQRLKAANARLVRATRAARNVLARMSTYNSATEELERALIDCISDDTPGGATDCRTLVAELYVDILVD